MSTIQAIVLAIIEGLTEFLPVSSTGHMIMASSFYGIAHEDFTKLFTIVIQLGTILSVVVLYFKRFFQSMDFYFKLLVAFLPAVVFGLLLSDYIDALLESPITVAVSLIIGGFVLLKVDHWFGDGDTSEISYMTALKIGFFQCQYRGGNEPKTLAHSRCRVFVFSGRANNARCNSKKIV